MVSPSDLITYLTTLFVTITGKFVNNQKSVKFNMLSMLFFGSCYESISRMLFEINAGKSRYVT